MLKKYIHNIGNFILGDKINKMKKNGDVKDSVCSNGHVNDIPNGRADDEGGGQHSTPRVSYAAAARKPPSPNTLNTQPTFNTSTSGEFEIVLRNTI